MNISQYNQLFNRKYLEGYYGNITGNFSSNSDAIATDKFNVTHGRHWFTAIDGKTISNPNIEYIFNIHKWNGSTYKGYINMATNTIFPYVEIPSDVDTIAIRMGRTTTYPNNISPLKSIFI